MGILSLIKTRVEVPHCANTIFLIGAHIQIPQTTSFLFFFSFFTRVYVHSEKFNDAAKVHLEGASILEYNMSNFIQNIGSESRKRNAMIWVNDGFRWST